MHGAPKLIVLRGNSGSGKSSVAKCLQAESRRRMAYVEQDYIRRTIFTEKEADDNATIGLVFHIVTFALNQKHDVVLEGILKFSRYKTMLTKLKDAWPEHYFYYFDIPFPETLQRHATKPNAHEFGETEMRQWYLPHDITGFPNEKVIPQTYSLDQSVHLILAETGLQT